MWTAADIPDQSGKTVVVTGGNSGIGYEAALQLAGKGAHVILACRDPERGRAAAASLDSWSAPSAALLVHPSRR